MAIKFIINSNILKVVFCGESVEEFYSYAFFSQNKNLV